MPIIVNMLTHSLVFKMTVKLFGDENVNLKDKVKMLKKRISEVEQRNTDLNSMVRFTSCILWF